MTYNKPTVKHGTCWVSNNSPYTTESDPPYKVNAIAKIVCDLGYKITSPDIASLFKDANGNLNWIPPSFECEPITTMILPTVINGNPGKVQRNEKFTQPPYHINDIFKPKCNLGHSFQGHATLQMVNDQLIWQPSTIQCEENSTYETPDVINGTITVNTAPPYKKNAIARLNCYIGYKSVGVLKSKLVLDQNGDLYWHPPTLECNPLTVNTLPNVTHGIPDRVKRGDQYVDAPYMINDTVKPICEDEFEARIPESTLQFYGAVDPKDNTLKWDPETLVCEPVHCPPLKTPKYANLKYSRLKDGLATYACQDKTVAIIERICQADGTWSGQEPECPAKKCFSLFEWILPILLLGCLILLFIIRMRRQKVYFLSTNISENDI